MTKLTIHNDKRRQKEAGATAVRESQRLKINTSNTMTSLWREFSAQRCGWLLAMLLFAGQVSWAAQSEAARIRVTGFTMAKHDDGEVLKDATKALAEIRSLLPSNDAGSPVHFVPCGNRPKSSCLPNTRNQWHRTAAIIRHLLVLRNGAGVTLQNPQVPDWLVAALCYRANSRLPDGRLMFPASRLLLQQQRAADIEKLLTHPVASDEPYLYPLYAENCAALLGVLRREQRDAPRRLLVGAATGQSPLGTFRILRPGTARQQQEWFIERLRPIAFSMAAPVSYRQVRQRLSELETIPIMNPSTTGAFDVQRVALEDLVKHVSTGQLSNTALLKLQEQLLALLNDSPPLLHPPLVAYIDAVKLLQSGRPSRFKRAIRDARKQFHEACERGEKIRSWLAEFEQEPGYLRLAAAMARPDSEAEQSAWRTQLKAYMRDFIYKPTANVTEK